MPFGRDGLNHSHWPGEDDGGCDPSGRRARRLVIDRAAIPTTPLAWTGARRIVQSLYPPIDLYEDVADAVDWPLLIAAKQKTNARLIETIAALDLIPSAPCGG